MDVKYFIWEYGPDFELILAEGESYRIIKSTYPENVGFSLKKKLIDDLLRLQTIEEISVKEAMYIFTGGNNGYLYRK